MRAAAQKLRESLVNVREKRELDELWGVIRDMEAAADKLDGLRPVEHSANVQDVTAAQIERRGRAIAASRVAEGDKLGAKIAASKWGSKRRYSKARLRISAASLVGYQSGATPCPRHVADKVKADFGLGPEIWPGGVVD